MTKLFALSMLVLFPMSVFAQEVTEYKLSPAGIVFMAFTWTAIIAWNVFCFKKILKK